MTKWSIVLMLVGRALALEPTAVLLPSEAVAADRTVIWTPTFQAGWDAMNEQLGGPPRESGNELAKKLDHFMWEKEAVLPEGRWKVWSGESTTEFFEQVNQEAAEFMFKDEGPFQKVESQSPGGVAFYSLLDAEISFVRPFFRSRKWPMSFRFGEDQTKVVKYWGVAGEESEDFSGSVRVLSWRPSQEFFAVELLSRSEEMGSVILFVPPEPMSFETSTEWIRTWRDRWEKSPGTPYGSPQDRFLHRNDRLRVPYLNFKVSSDFADKFRGNRIYGKKGDSFRVTTPRQRVEFELDERGARVTVAAEGGMDPFAGPPPTTPTDLSFDRPFFVFLWRADAKWPYFAAWIGDAEGMTESGE